MRQLTDAIPTQLIGGVDGQLGVLLADDFALFTEGEVTTCTSAPLAM